MSTTKNIFIVVFILVFVAITYVCIGFSAYAPVFFILHVALFLAAASWVNLETGYLFAILSTISGVGTLMALENRALIFWVGAEMVLLWVTAAGVAVLERRVRLKGMEHARATAQVDAELSQIERQIRSYEARIASIQGQADLRRKLAQGVTLLGRSLSPGEIQTAIKEAVHLCFSDCAVGITWFSGNGESGLDPFELWVKDSRAPLLVADTMADARFRSNFEKGGFLYPYRSLALLPLAGNAAGGRRGVLKVQAKEPGRLSKEDLRILDLFARLGNLAFENAGLHQQVQDLAMHDPMTGLHTRKILEERLEQECAKTSRYRVVMSLAIVDIDHFKRVNDTYGHMGGDALLKQIAGLIRSSIREVDFAARYGGEEFVVLFPETSRDQAAVFMDDFRRRVEAHIFETDKGHLRVTVSVGVASYPDETTSARQLMRAADERLYLAKGGGRNRVIY